MGKFYVTVTSISYNLGTQWDVCSMTGIGLYVSNKQGSDITHGMGPRYKGYGATSGSASVGFPGFKPGFKDPEMWPGWVLNVDQGNKCSVVCFVAPKGGGSGGGGGGKWKHCPVAKMLKRLTAAEIQLGKKLILRVGGGQRLGAAAAAALRRFAPPKHCNVWLQGFDGWRIPTPIHKPGAALVYRLGSHWNSCSIAESTSTTPGPRNQKPKPLCEISFGQFQGFPSGTGTGWSLAVKVTAPFDTQSWLTSKNVCKVICTKAPTGGGGGGGAGGVTEQEMLYAIEGKLRPLEAEI